MQIIRLNNVGRKFHKFIHNGELSESTSVAKGDSFKDGAFWALRNIYISINDREIIGIIGRNGAGKSTLLNIIAGRLPVSEGEVIVNGKISALLTLGAGFQDEFTGKENVYLNGSLLGMKKQEIEKKFMDILGFSELGNFINAPLGSYSTGMKLRLGFSVAIHNDFDALITDEIITVGDIYFQKKCYEKIVEFKRQGKSIVMATQDMGIIERFCDKVFLLEDGRIFFSGKPAETIEQYGKLLNKKKILSEGNRSYIVTETKRWATDMEEWGKREGTKEVSIKNIVIFNKRGRKIDKIKTGEKIIVKTNFMVNEEIDDFHFGVAFFREDGVYCYGPNTQFDGLATDRMGKGEGYFELELGKLMLMPGIYFVSSAIWDKDERVAYDYHKCTYKIEIAGDCNHHGQLLYLPNRDKRYSLAVSKAQSFPNLDFLVDKWESHKDSDLVKLESVAFLNSYGTKDSVFLTSRDFKIKVDYRIDESLRKNLKFLIFWLGIYRSDGIYCYGSINKVNASGENIEILTYPKLGLLPGGYKVSIGIWDAKAEKFILYSHGLHSFNMISEKRDHGTIFLEHSWRWKIPSDNKEERQNEK